MISGECLLLAAHMLTVIGYTLSSYANVSVSGVPLHNHKHCHEFLCVIFVFYAPAVARNNTIIQDIPSVGLNIITGSIQRLY